ncbi:MAG: class I SAM-dependent methyltransferase [Spirochaetales bacterium]|nr:class I SAM-dependent methyltransferase [Spirochaetales bacterium]
MKTYSEAPGQERTRWILCPLCGADASRPFLAGEGFRYVRCCACRLVFQNPQPLLQDLRRRYAAGYFRYELENELNFFNLMKLGLADIRFDRLAAGIPRPRKFLDIGCATGMLLDHVRGQGWEVEGVEVCRESAEHGIRERSLRIHIGTLEEASLPGASFAVVHGSHLIEHVPDPRALLAEIRRVLAPGGRLIVTTPNVDGFQAKLFRGRWRSAIADHLVLFSKRTLRALLVRAGFRVLAVRTWGGLAKGAAPGWIKRPVDALAKALGFGDVVLMLAEKGRGADSGAGAGSGGRAEAGVGVDTLFSIALGLP